YALAEDYRRHQKSENGHAARASPLQTLDRSRVRGARHQSDSQPKRDRREQQACPRTQGACLEPSRPKKGNGGQNPRGKQEKQVVRGISQQRRPEDEENAANTRRGAVAPRKQQGRAQSQAGKQKH